MSRELHSQPHCTRGHCFFFRDVLCKYPDHRLCSSAAWAHVGAAAGAAGHGPHRGVPQHLPGVCARRLHLLPALQVRCGACCIPTAGLGHWHQTRFLVLLCGKALSGTLCSQHLNQCFFLCLNTQSLGHAHRAALMLVNACSSQDTQRVPLRNPGA